MFGFSIPVVRRKSAAPEMRHEEPDAMRDMARADLGVMVGRHSGACGRGCTRNSACARSPPRALARTTFYHRPDSSERVRSGAYRVGQVNLMTLLDAQMTVNRYQQERYLLGGRREAKPGPNWKCWSGPSCSMRIRAQMTLRGCPNEARARIRDAPGPNPRPSDAPFGSVYQAGNASCGGHWRRPVWCCWRVLVYLGDTASGSGRAPCRRGMPTR